MSKRRTRTFPFIRVGLACVLFAIGMAPTVEGAQADPLRLERVVLVTRHGVRAPLRANQILRNLTRRDWPAWPGGAGDMTPHGAQALAAMVDYVRSTYVAAGLLPAAACPPSDAITVWSDVTDRRTRESGDIWAAHIAPGCGLKAAHATAGRLDPIFDANDNGTCPVGLSSAARELWRASRPNGLIGPAVQNALTRLQAIVAPNGCGWLGRGVCLKPGPTDSRVTLAAKLALGGMIAEAIYLEYVQGFPEAQVGWGRAGTPAAIAAITPAHDADLALRKGTEALAARHGSVLARTVLSLLKGEALDTPISPAARLVIFAGHDTNLIQLATLIGLGWHFPRQPSVTAPDTVLAFEVWRDPTTRERTIGVKVYAQTLDQLRAATPLGENDAPDMVEVQPDVCAHTTCALDHVAIAVGTKLAKLCRPR